MATPCDSLPPFFAELVPEPHFLWSEPLLLATIFEIFGACPLLVCTCVHFIVSVSLIVGMCYPRLLTINTLILIQMIAELLWEDEL